MSLPETPFPLPQPEMLHQHAPPRRDASLSSIPFPLLQLRQREHDSIGRVEERLDGSEARGLLLLGEEGERRGERQERRECE